VAHFGKLATGAFIAAPLGSLIGGVASLPFVAPEGASLPLLGGVALLIAVFGCILAFPALLLVGMPLSWPFRQAIYRHPVPFTVLYGFIGAFLGLWTALITGAAAGDTLVPSLTVGAGVAAAWIVVMCRNRDWLN